MRTTFTPLARRGAVLASSRYPEPRFEDRDADMTPAPPREQAAVIGIAVLCLVALVATVGLVAWRVLG